MRQSGRIRANRVYGDLRACAECKRRKAPEREIQLSDVNRQNDKYLIWKVHVGIIDEGYHLVSINDADS